MTNLIGDKKQPKPQLVIEAYPEFVHPEFEAKLPIQGSAASVGLDIYSYCISENGTPNSVMIPPGASRPVNTGLVVIPPPGYWLGLYSRSGMASWTNPVFVANAPGVIDPDYRGELKVLLYNGGHQTVWIKHEQRIAQLILHEYHAPAIEWGKGQPSTTERGVAGFGSTGMGEKKR
jgi:dUTP pyrophosphatase